MLKCETETLVSPMSVKLVKVYYLFGFPVWRKDLHKLGDKLARFDDEEIKS